MEAIDTAGTFEDVLGYHQRTKHHLHRYARSAGYMDWENQPSPFRFYEGTAPEPLPFLKADPGAGRPNFYVRYHTPPAPLIRGNVAGFLELSLGLSAWKSAGAARWSLRINPSSGNLHPTEAHLILPPEKDRPSGLYHYNPFLHALEQRGRVPETLWDQVLNHLGTEAFLMALTSIFWRESWKYGERAFRYCLHDAGHALAAAAFSAALFGWRVTVLTRLSDEQIERILGFDRTRWPAEEAEHPDLMFAVHPEDRQIADRGLPASLVDSFPGITLDGRPNRLSRKPVHWRVITEVARKTRKMPTDRSGALDASPSPYPGLSMQAAPAAVIRQRRSATDFDPSFNLSRDHFLAILDGTLPRRDRPPFDAGLPAAEAQLLLFVHRVEDVDPGLYLFLRNPEHESEMRKTIRSEFLWKTVEPGFPLFLLRRQDLRKKAMQLSCHQPIAGDGVFSLGMISRFEDCIREAPWRYRTLFMETGMIGQVLYLEAEARGIRGTGIGCFFDDAVHELAGISGVRYQSLYHFTMGLPVPDARLRTDPPYSHLKKHALFPEAGRRQ
jgi:SagB-type dehydrogenase family enzyme